jgi:hypothetical protein
VQQVATQTPAQLVGGLLDAHPEAASLLAEVSHRRALAAMSARLVAQTYRACQAARLRLDESRHKLDPRIWRRLHFGIGLAVVAVLAWVLTILSDYELIGTASASVNRLLPICATAVWLMAAWLGGVSAREGRTRIAAAIAAGIVFLSVLLVGMHVVMSAATPQSPLRHVAEHVAAMVMIDLLTADAAVLIARMEPLSVMIARHHWRRAEARHRAAHRLERKDSEAASVAMEAWLGLVRARASAARTDGEPGSAALDDQALEQTLSIASSLHALGSQ